MGLVHEQLSQGFVGDFALLVRLGIRTTPWLLTCVAFLCLCAFGVFVKKSCSQIMKVNPFFKSLKPRSKEELEEEESLLRHTPDGPLETVWNQYASEHQQGPMKILLTGVTGYVGGGILHELLSRIKKDRSPFAQEHRIFVTVRAKSTYSKEERFELVRKQPIFAGLMREMNSAVELVEAGDLAAPHCGIADRDLELLNAAGVTHVIHCAAEVRFNPPMDDIGRSNITASLRVKELASRWDLQRFVYISTAFVHPARGTEDEPNLERLVDLRGYDAKALYESMMSPTDKSLAEKAKKEIGFKNNYTMSKCVAEHLLVEDTSLPLTILRPAIVGPASALPYQGWNGKKPSTVTGVYTLMRLSVIKFTAPRDHSIPLPVVPVDFVAVAAVHSLLEQKQAKSCSPRIRHLVCDFYQNFSGSIDFGVAIGVWSVSGCIARQLFDVLLRALPVLFQPLDLLINRLPLHVWNWLQQITLFLNPDMKVKPITAKRVLGFVDVLADYNYFMTTHFHFERSWKLSSTCTNVMYELAILKAIENFLPPFLRHCTANVSTQRDPYTHTAISPRNRYDFWWALSLPSGSFAQRSWAYFMARMIRQTFGDVVLDLRSAATVAHMIDENQKNDKSVVVCLMPMRESYFDSALLSFVAFSIPGSGLKDPRIVLPKAFQGYPFSTFMRWANLLIESVGQDRRLDEKIDELISNQGTAVVPLDGPESKAFFSSLTQAAKMSDKNVTVVVVPVAVSHQQSLNTGNTVPTTSECARSLSVTSRSDAFIEFGKPFQLEEGVMLLDEDLKQRSEELF